MPLYTNIGGKLTEIKSLNTTTGDILKPIYGTPKENLTLHWGGFTGTSSANQDDFLIGQFNIDSPTYVTNYRKPTDNLNNLYTSVPSDLATQLGITTEQWETTTTFMFSVTQKVKYKIEKTTNKDKYYTSYTRTFNRIFEKNLNGNWEKTTDTFDNYSSIGTLPLSIDENIYYVYVNKYACICAKDSNGYFVGVGEKYLDFSQMNINVEFKFQTLSEG